MAVVADLLAALHVVVGEAGGGAGLRGGLVQGVQLGHLVDLHRGLRGVLHVDVDDARAKLYWRERVHHGTFRRRF